jgi:hypothetical protein
VTHACRSPYCECPPGQCKQGRRDARAEPVRCPLGSDHLRCVLAINHSGACRADQPAPINMVLHCPRCGTQHVDRAEGEIRGGELCLDWANPPHRSHLCAKCGCIWRPADVATNGVTAVATRGKGDTWAPGQPSTGLSPAAREGFRAAVREILDINRLYTLEDLILLRKRWDDVMPGGIDPYEVDKFLEWLAHEDQRVQRDEHRPRTGEDTV